jgi:transcriptional regulator with XRE-family HTH domain
MRPSDPYRRLGAYFASKRRRAGLSQCAVAAAIGQHQSWVSLVEHGRRQHLDVIELLLLADVIGFEPTEALRVLQRSGASSSRRRPTSTPP